MLIPFLSGALQMKIRTLDANKNFSSKGLVLSTGDIIFISDELEGLDYSRFVIFLFILSHGYLINYFQT
jgi:hypothetical protein